jgi:hypothetical protein
VGLPKITTHSEKNACGLRLNLTISGRSSETAPKTSEKESRSQGFPAENPEGLLLSPQAAQLCNRLKPKN